MQFELGPYYRRKEEYADRSVYLCDCTLRDGEQCGVFFTLEEKLSIAHRLSDAGVKQVQVGSLRKEADHTLARELCARGLEADIEVMTRATAPTWRREVEDTVRYGADVTHSLVPLSPYTRGAYGEALDNAGIMARITAVVAHAKSCGANKISITLLDATRCEPGLLKEAVLAAAHEGADILNLPDTVGVATPEMTTAFISMVRKWLDESGRGSDVALRVHFHNDFGLATANAMAAVLAGADIVDTCINGLGKRAGNVDMVQAGIGLKVLHGIDTGLKIEGLYALCQDVSLLAGIPISGNWPFLGDLVFADDSESHIVGATENPFAFQAIDPTGWGEGRKVLITRSGGIGALGIKLAHMGLPSLNEDDARRLLEVCHKAAAQKLRGQCYIDTEDLRNLYYSQNFSTRVREGDRT